MLKPHHHRYLYLLGLLLMAVGLPTSKFLMSLSQFVLVGNWLLEGNYRKKFIAFWNDKPAVFITVIYCIHLIGLLYTSDIEYGLKDIRIKLPLLVFPLIIASSRPLNKKELKGVLLAFALTVTVVCLGTLLLIQLQDIENMRKAPLLISRIRFGLLGAVAAFILVRNAWYEEIIWRKVGYATAIIIVLFTMVYIQLASGLVAFVITAIIGLFYFGKRQKKKIRKLSLVSAAIAIPLLCVVYIGKQVYEFYQPIDKTALESLPYANPNNEKYEHYPQKEFVENGNYIWLYIVRKELKKQWNERSTIPFDSTDQQGQPVFATMVRYLTSKGLKKDSAGLAQLSSEEISAIEKGIANVRFLNEYTFADRIYSWIWQIDNYRKGGNPSGNSLTQRLEFWKTAILIWKDNMLFGVGTGDVKKAFEEKYVETHSKLKEQNRHRAHNQYLTFGLTFGWAGFLLILFCLLYPLLFSKQRLSYFFLTFYSVALLSCLNEDTLETQVGVSFFIFFYAVLLLATEKRN